jgi:hypothetical protein
MAANTVTKTRSPNYPIISLPDAVQRIQRVYESEHTHLATRDVIARALGYGGINGASAGLVSALAKYGLLEVVKEQYRVSETALDILLHPKGDPERVRAIQGAALAPSLFKELHGHYDGRLPSDVNLRAYLVKRGFNPKTVDGVIRVYRDTIEFVDGETQFADAEASDDLHVETPMQTQGATETREKKLEPLSVFSRMNPVNTGTNEQVLVVPIADDCEIHVLFRGRVTQERLDYFAEWVTLFKKRFPKEDVPTTSTAPAIQEGS